MRKVLLGLLFLAVAFSVIPPYYPKRLILFGRGIAINPENLDEFHFIRVGYGALLVWKPAIDDFVEVKVGVLRFDNKTYYMRNITVENETVKGVLIDKVTKEVAGSFEVRIKRYLHRRVWYGKLVLDKEYRVYVIEALPMIPIVIQKLPLRIRQKLQKKLGEYYQVREKIRECLNNPTPECRQIIRNALRKGDVWARELARRYCEIHGC